MSFRGFMLCIFDLLFTRYVKHPNSPPEPTYYPDGERS